MNKAYAGIAIAMLTVSSLSLSVAAQTTPPAPQPQFDANPAVPPAARSRKAEEFHRLEDILYYSYMHNPSLRAARAEMKAVQEGLPQALAGWKPSLDLSGNVTKADIDGSTFGGDGTTSKEIELALSQPLYRGGRTVSATESAENLISAQRLLLENFEQTILLSMATAYMDVYRDTSLLELSHNNKDVIGRQLEASQNRFDVGEITRTDVAQSEARMARANADLIKAEGDYQRSRAVYEKFSGLLPSTLGKPNIAFPIPKTLSEVLDAVEKNNPEIRASSYLHRAAEEDIDVIFGELMPQLSLFAVWNKQFNPQPGRLADSTSKSIGVSASMPIYEGGFTRSRVRQAKYTANQRYLEILDARRRMREEAVSNWENLKAARAEIASRIVQVDAARIAREGVYQEAELGSRTILDSLDADQEYLDAQTALVAAQRNEIVATFALAKTMGLLTPQTLGFPAVAEDFEALQKEANSKILGMDVKIDEGKP